jgi:adenylyltransferase/sulfurtransferase
VSYLQRIVDEYSASGLSPEERVFYARHLLLPTVGTVGQLKLKTSRVLVVGAGGLGCPLLQALAGAGVGHLTVMDADRVEASNLARQWLHRVEDIGKNKAISAVDTIAGLNPHIRCEALPRRFDRALGPDFVGRYDVLVDASDNLRARLDIDALCQQADRPWVHAALYRNRFQVGLFWARFGALYSALFPAQNEQLDCAQAGVLGATASAAAHWQAIEVIKLVTGGGPVSPGTLLDVDPVAGKLQRFRMPATGMPATGMPEALDVPGDHLASPGWSPDRVRQALSIAEPVAWIDLRPPGEFATGSLGEALNLQAEAILKDPSILPSAPALCFICANGTVSGLLADALSGQDDSRPRIYHLAGGMEALKQADSL